MLPARRSVCALVLVLLSPALFAQEPKSPEKAVPRLIHYSGTLTGNDGRPLTGVQSVTFAFYGERASTSSLWLETQTVSADEQGRFVVLLGATRTEGVPLDIFTSGAARWLGVQVAGQEEQARAALTSVPYALAAESAEAAETIVAGGVVDGGGRIRSVTPPNAGTAGAAGSGSPQPQTPTGDSTTPRKPATDSSHRVLLKLFDLGPAPSAGDYLILGRWGVTDTFTVTTGGNVTAASYAGDGSALTGVNATTIANDSVTSAKIANGSVVDADVSASAAISPSKIAGTAATLGANTFSATQTISSGNLALPNTAGSGSGVITFGGSPFIHRYGILNAFFGAAAGSFGLTGVANTGVGANVLNSVTSGSYNTGIGVNSLYGSTSGLNNTGVGYQTLFMNSTANGSTALGAYALSNMNGFLNTGVGYRALFASATSPDNNTGRGNTALGADALYSQTSGDYNAALGQGALFYNTTGNDNIGVGHDAGVTWITANANVSGSSNTFLGQFSGPGTPTQLTNATAIGARAVVSASNALVLGSINGVNGATADVNVGIGTATPGSRLTVKANGAETNVGDMGCEAGFVGIALAASPSSCTNYSILGGTGGTYLNRASGGGIYFRENNLTQMFIASGGNVRIGASLSAGAQKLQVDGNVRIGGGSSSGCLEDGDGTLLAGTCASDARLKKNIAPFERLVEKVAQLQPVRFYWRADEFPERQFGRNRSFGLVAQDVETVLPELVSEDENGYKCVQYSELPLLAIQAIRDLKADNDALREELRSIRAQLEEVKRLALPAGAPAPH